MSEVKIHLRSRTYKSKNGRKTAIDFNMLDKIIGSDFPIRFRYTEVLEINLLLVYTLLEIRGVLLNRNVDLLSSLKTMRYFVRGFNGWRELTNIKSKGNRARIGDNKYVVTIYHSTSYKYEVIVLDLMVLEKDNPSLLN